MKAISGHVKDVEISARAAERWAFAALQSSEMLVYVDAEGRILDSNDSFRRNISSAPDGRSGSADAVLLESCFEGNEKIDALRRHLTASAAGSRVDCEIRFKPAGKTMERTYEFQMVPLSESEEDSITLVRIVDITELKRDHERMRLYEFKDRRTGLPNRRALELVLEKELARIRHSPGTEIIAVLFISLENFARINQTYGHEIGDILLENSGLRIKETIISELLRDSDYVFAGDSPQEDQFGTGESTDPKLVDPERLVFRFEGRELTAVLTGIERETDAAVVAMRIVRSVTMPYRDKYGSEIFINCNIGIAIYPNDGDDTAMVLDHAASAMQEAKRLGEEFLLFNRKLHKTALEKMRLGGSIYNAFIESQFELFMQPVVDLLGDIVGAEGLIRWRHPERGIVKPDDFIPLAEEKGIIVNIGKWTLYTAVQLLSRWPKNIYMSLNVSPRELDNVQLVDNVIRVLGNAPNVDPEQLKLEITERDSMRNPEEAIRKMRALSSRGIDIMIDDFGTGHSSLRYLKELPASTLKVDRSFVASIVEDDDDRRFLESIVDLAYSRNKDVIIEGVETIEQLEIIRRMKPVKLQGYYFSEPVPAAVFEELVERRVRLPIE